MAVNFVGDDAREHALAAVAGRTSTYYNPDKNALTDEFCNKFTHRLAGRYIQSYVNGILVAENYRMPYALSDFNCVFINSPVTLNGSFKFYKGEVITKKQPYIWDLMLLPTPQPAWLSTALVSPYMAFAYVKKFGPIKELEPVLAETYDFAVKYAIRILKGRFLAGEKTIFPNVRAMAKYFRHFSHLIPEDVIKQQEKKLNAEGRRSYAYLCFGITEYNDDLFEQYCRRGSGITLA